ncbi:hypothetical protein EMIT043CA1_280054 [Pseudomonas brassicacearum]
MPRALKAASGKRGEAGILDKILRDCLSLDVIPSYRQGDAR